MVECQNQYDLTSTFMRLQEFYESPFSSFKGKHFTHEDYMDKYASENPDGNFTYFIDWNGFNVPGNIVSDFWDLYAPNLWQKEANLFYEIHKAVGGNLQTIEPFYIIGVYKGVDDYEETILHELSHAYWYLQKKFKTSMTAIVTKLAKKKELKEFNNLLMEKGYDKSVLLDETVAYLSTAQIPEFLEVVNFKNEDIKEILSALFLAWDQKLTLTK